RRGAEAHHEPSSLRRLRRPGQHGRGSRRRAGRYGGARLTVRQGGVIAMPAMTRRISAMILLASTMACPGPAPRASASDAPAEIRLGKQAVPALKANPAAIRAVERFFAARQGASLDRTRLAAARHLITGAVRGADATLAGAAGEVIIAFDFAGGENELL